MHAAFGRGAEVRAGCVREGVKTWLIGEVILLELTDCAATRRRDPRSGFNLLSLT
jgi:predicted DNA-binding protein with PD1-like motif